MSDTALLWLIAILGVIAAIVATVGAVLVWRRLVRRYLVGLVGGHEHVRAARRTLEAVMRHLADESDEALVAFASDPDSEDRRALAEVAARMRLLHEELDVMALPKNLWPVGEALADVAYLLAEEAGRLTDETAAEHVVATLGLVNLSRVAAEFDAADALLREALEENHLTDAAVYGGGLYI